MTHLTQKMLSCTYSPYAKLEKLSQISAQKGDTSLFFVLGPLEKKYLTLLSLVKALTQVTLLKGHPHPNCPFWTNEREEILRNALGSRLCVPPHPGRIILQVSTPLNHPPQPPLSPLPKYQRWRVWLYLVDSQPTIIRPIQGASQREETILENWPGTAAFRKWSEQCHCGPYLYDKTVNQLSRASNVHGCWAISPDKLKSVKGTGSANEYRYLFWRPLKLYQYFLYMSKLFRKFRLHCEK